jgi:hypothetical protein
LGTFFLNGPDRLARNDFLVPFAFNKWFLIWLSLIGDLEIQVTSLHVEMAALDSVGDWNVAGDLGKRLMPQVFSGLTTIAEVWRLKVILLLFCIIVFLGGIWFSQLTSCFVFLLFAMELLKFNLASLFLINFLDLWAVVLLWSSGLLLWLWGFLSLNFSLLFLNLLNPLLVFIE